jgi:hypothetical protein
MTMEPSAWFVLILLIKEDLPLAKASTWGIDVMAACNLAMVDVRVRSPYTPCHAAAVTV